MPLPHEEGWSLAAVGLNDGNIHLFRGRGSPIGLAYGGNVWHTWTEPDPYHWRPGDWELLGGPNNYDVSALHNLRGLCATTWDGVNIHVFASAPGYHLGEGKVMHMWTEPNPYHWNQGGWTELDWPPDEPYFCSTTDWNNSNLQLFMFDGDILDHKWTNYAHDFAQGWNPDGWVSVGNYLKQHKTFGHNIAACRWADGNIQVFAWNDGSVLHHMWTEPDPYHWNQGGWIALGPAFGDNFDLAATSWNGPNLQVFAFNQGVLHRMWTEPDPYHWNQGGWKYYSIY
jgi:hypothetical protein